jgi:hypothetical protein
MLIGARLSMVLPAMIAYPLVVLRRVGFGEGIDCPAADSSHETKPPLRSGGTIPYDTDVMSD